MFITVIVRVPVPQQSAWYISFYNYLLCTYYMLGTVLALNDAEGMLLALKKCNLVEETNITQINGGKVSEGKQPGAFRKN